MDLSNPAATATIKLDRERQLVFDMNTFAAFERQTGKFFLDFVATLLAAASPGEDFKPVDALTVLRKVALSDILAFVWAATHEYTPAGDIVWPLTLSQVGRLVRLDNLPDVLSAVFRSQSENLPNEQELGEHLGPAPLADAAGVEVRPLQE